MGGLWVVGQGQWGREGRLSLPFQCHAFFNSFFGPTQLNQASFYNDFQDNYIAQGGERSFSPLGEEGESVVPKTNLRIAFLTV